jgi:hypothetical protein
MAVKNSVTYKQTKTGYSVTRGGKTVERILFSEFKSPIEAEKELVRRLDYLNRHANPAPRLGTARPRRVSQVTKKPPTKRLVTRRRANTQAGYFPNPVNPPLNETEFMAHLYRSKELAMKRSGTVAKRQAAVSYAEGMATGAMLLGLFDRKERDTFMAEIGATHGVK